MREFPFFQTNDIVLFGEIRLRSKLNLSINFTFLKKIRSICIMAFIQYLFIILLQLDIPSPCIDHKDVPAPLLGTGQVDQIKGDVGHVVHLPDQDRRVQY